MEKVIKLGKQEVKLNNNVAWTMEYRDQFGKDILPTILPMFATLIETASALIDDDAEIKLTSIVSALEGRATEILLPLYQVELVDIAVNVTWSMAKVADDSIDPPKKWVKQFDVFPIDIIVPTVFEMALKGFTSSKNLKRLKTIKESLKNLQPSLSMTSSSQDSSEA